MSKPSTARALRVPAALQPKFEQICNLTGPICAEYLDSEYGDLVQKLVAKLARKRPSPLLRGEVRVWAGAAIYTIGSLNFLGDELSALVGVPKGTLGSKAKLIRDALRIEMFDPEFSRREILAANPMAWMVSVNGFIVDARTMPSEVQAEARRRGLVPELPAERARVGDLELQTGLEPPVAGIEEARNLDTPAMGLSEAVNEVIGILGVAAALPGSPSADGWARIVRTVAESGSLPDGLVAMIEKAIAEAYDSWSDSRRRSVWHETDSGMTDDDDDDALCDTSVDGIGHALQVEMLDEVTRAAWRDADEVKKAAAKRRS